jgi:GNAT superfamily N-acetyltransferase
MDSQVDKQVSLPMVKSLHSQYVMEREGGHLIEYSWGFAIYKLYPDSCYLQDIFVVEEERKNGRGVQLLNEVVEIAKQKGLHKLAGSVVPNTPFGHTMLTIMLSLGFKLHAAQQDIVYLMKEI